MAASWKKVLLEGVNDQKDLVTGAGLTGGEDNVLVGTNADVTIELDINGLTADDGATHVGDLIAVYDISANSNAGAHAKKTQLEVAPIQALTFGPAIRNSSVDAATGNYGIGLDVTELTTVASLAAKTFLPVATDSTDTMDHADQKKILIENIGLSEFNNDLGLTDKFTSDFVYVAGTTAGPTATITVDNGTNVSVDAIPSAASGASGIVTTGAQNLAGDKTFDNDVIVTGSLTVNGDLTTIDTDNLIVKDTFISMNNGGASNVDAGIVFEGAANKVFAWDQSEGRFSVSYSGGNATAAGGGFTRLGDMAVTHNAGGSGSAGASTSLQQYGNFFVNSAEEALYVWA